jgi:HlyD family secretion protein
MKVMIDNWGGRDTLRGVVRTVEPFGFTKVSALGIEEQRVNVIIGLVDDRRLWKSLGHGFRVDVSVITWESEGSLIAPMGAVFRDGEQQAVYVVVNGRASLRHIVAGHTNTTQVEVLGGVSEGEMVVLYPTDRIQNGSIVRDRATVQ